MKAYVLDTSALLALIEDEGGGEDVEALLKQALDGQVVIFISVITCIEVFYISQQEQGAEIAVERLRLIEDLQVQQEPLDEHLIRTIGDLKATQSLSFADCCIAGLAKHKQAMLVHKDPEFEQIEAFSN